MPLLKQSNKPLARTLANGDVDVPMPMHIGIHETLTAGPGNRRLSHPGRVCRHLRVGCTDLHRQVGLRQLFYKNAEKGLPTGSGVFIVVDAVTGAPLAVMQENR
jgi:hypothetical protein